MTQNSETKFYIELPGDEGGNISMPRAVVEGRIVQGGPAAHPWTNPARQAIVFSAPPDVAERWRGSYVDAYGGFAEVDGPARMLSREEYYALLSRVRPHWQARFTRR